MSSELGKLFSDGDQYSPAIFDAKSIVVHSGTYITAIPEDKEFGAARALDDTGGLRQDEFYWPNADHNALIPAHWAHKHQTGDHWNGGSNQEIVLANMREYQQMLMGATAAMYHTGVSGSGVVDNVSASIRVRTGLTSNSWARIFKGGIGISFANKILWRSKMRVNDDLAQLVRVGVRMEDPANNADNLEKMGFEGCDGDGPNYRLVTANGVGRHKEPTALPIEQTSFRGYAVLLEPGTTVTYQYDDGTSFAETNNIPSIGNASDSEAIKMGIKTTNSNEKILTIAAVNVFAISGDSDWFQMEVTA